MRPVLKYFSILLLLWLLFGFTSAQTINMNIPDTTATTGDIIKIPVYVETSLTGNDVYSFRLQIDYNGSRLRMDSVTNVGTISETWGDIFFNQTGAGQITVAAAGSQMLEGSGVLVYLKFTAISSGYSNINFSNIENNYFNEGQPEMVLDNGYISISDPPVITVTPHDGLLLSGEQMQFYVSGGTSPYNWGVTSDIAEINESGLLTAGVRGFTRVFVEDTGGSTDTTDGFIEIRDVRLSLPDTTAYQGYTLDIPLYTTDLSILEITSGNMTITYNSSRLEVVDIIKAGTILETTSWMEYNIGEGFVNISFADNSNITGEGVLLYIRFELSSINYGGSNINIAEAIFNENIAAIADNGYCTVSQLYNLNVSPSSVTLVAGETRQLSVSGGTGPYVWTSSESAIAEVDASGLLTAVSDGQVVITAEDAYTATGSANVTVYDTRVIIENDSAAITTYYDLPVLIEDIPSGLDVFSIQADIEFNGEMLEYNSIVTDGTLISGWLVTDLVEGETILLASAGATGITIPGTLFKIRFRVLPTAPEGYQASVQFNELLLNEGRPSALGVNGYIFTLPVEPPDIPQLSEPEDGAADVPVNPVFYWHLTDWAQTYDLQISTVNDFSSLVAEQTGITDTTTGVLGLSEQTTFFWRVRAVNSLDESEWSEIWSFTTVESGGIPAVFSVGILQNPLFTEITDIYIIGEEPLEEASLSAEAILNNDSTTLNLIASGNTGRIFVENDYNLNATGILQLDISGKYISSDLLPNDTTIYITVALPEPEKDLLIASTDNLFTINIPGEEIKKEQYILLKKGMNFEIETDNSEFISIYSIVSAIKHMNNKAMVSFELEDLTFNDLSYQICVLKNNEWVKLSTSIDREKMIVTASTDYIGTFSLRLANNIDEETDTQVREFALYQNYPNPFNPSTNIQFRIKEKAFTALEIYNILGKRVKVIVKKELDAGEYTYTWETKDEKGENVPSGIYLSVLKVNGQKYSKKMVLIR